MQIGCLEVGYKKAPVAIREQISFSDDALADGFQGAGAEPATIDGVTIVSTCNRVEVYVSSSDGGIDSTWLRDRAVDLICAERSVSSETILTHANWYTNDDAVKHLCRVASGLESQVMGESQILGQVARANEIATRHKANNPTLKQLFQTAIRCGKRARAETAIGRHARPRASQRPDLEN